MSVTGAGDAVLDALEMAAAKAVEASIIASVPFLAAPPLAFLLDKLVNFILNIAKTKIEVAAYVAYSTAVVDHQVGAVNDAASKSVQERIDAARALGHLNNVN